MSRLRRYTNLPSTLHILRNKCLTLVSPAMWDDKNDAYFMDQYKERIGAQSLLALCFAEAAETYHHWRVFSHGSDGVCLEFDRSRLEPYLAVPGTEFREVRYERLNDAKSKVISTRDLPFVKRYGYQDEREFRAVYADMREAKKTKRIEIPLSCISRITLSPWMPEELADAVRETIRSLEGCRRMKVCRSTLIRNATWMRLANPKLKS